MNAAVEKALWPNELTLHSIETSDGVKDYYPATVRVEFRGVEHDFEKAFLTKILEALPVLLAAADDSDIQTRLEHLCRAFQPGDWRISRDTGMLLTGKSYIEWFFKTLPLLNEQEARKRMPSNTTINLADLMQITYNQQTFYFADQFSTDGSIHPECIEYWRILASESTDPEWDRALWWVSGTGWLAGRCAPREVFKEDPEGVLHAATQESIRNAY